MFALSPFDNKTPSMSPKRMPSLWGPIEPLAPRLPSCRRGAPSAVCEGGAGGPSPRRPETV